MSSDGRSAEWRDVMARIGQRRIALGPYFTYILLHTPRRLLHLLSYYKFAAKMIGPKKRILEIGCSEGIGSVILAESASSCLGVDLDPAAISIASETVGSERLRFQCVDVFQARPGRFDAVVALDIIEHIEPHLEDRFFEGISAMIEPHGVFLCGTPNVTSDQYASEITRFGHINLYSADRLRDLAGRHFHNVFMFSANDEMVHTGFSPMAHYLIALCVHPKDAVPS